MADGKNKILVYRDWLPQFEKLTDEEAGQLIKHFFRYVNDLSPDPPNRIVELCFEPIKQTLKRDLVKWESFAEKQSENGKLGGRPPKPKESQKTQAFLNKPKKAVSVSVSVNDSVTVNDSESNHTQFPIFEKFIFELTETEINAAKEINNRQTGQIPTEKDIGNWLYIFRQVNFTGQKFYENRTEIVKHFKNWVKSQKLQSNGNITNSHAGANGTAKKGTSEARMEYLAGLK